MFGIEAKRGSVGARDNTGPLQWQAQRVPVPYTMHPSMYATNIISDGEVERARRAEERRDETTTNPNLGSQEYKI